MVVLLEYFMFNVALIIQHIYTYNSIMRRVICQRSYSYIVAMDTASGVYMSSVSTMYCSRAQNNALSHLLTHFSIWPNIVQFGRTK